MNWADKMLEINPDRGPVFTAIDTLETEEDITRFHEDYRVYMKREGYDAQTADDNIGYILGYYGEETKKLWYGILEVSHPIFGERFGR